MSPLFVSFAIILKISLDIINIQHRKSFYFQNQAILLFNPQLRPKAQVIVNSFFFNSYCKILVIQMANFKLQYFQINMNKCLEDQVKQIKIPNQIKNYQIKILIRSIAFIYLIHRVSAINTNITDNTCTFKREGKLFTLTMLNKFSDSSFYSSKIDNNTEVIFNFCEPIIPKQCMNHTDISKAYSFVVLYTKDGSYDCIPYSSNSKTSNFQVGYTHNNNDQILTLQLSKLNDTKSTKFVLTCSRQINETIINIHSKIYQNLTIYAESPYVCPVFELSSIWNALTQNLFIFGIILFILGFVMLFYGILMTHLMIFVAAYLLSFALLFGIFTTFLAPNSSSIAIYFSLLVIIFLATVIAYSLTRLVKISVFFIGAFFGFILAALINSIFCKIFDIYSVWSLIIFQIVLIIRFGFLSFKYSEQVIILSTSLTGSYMLIRPISWIFGGFPNQFTLYLQIQNRQIKTLPWSFFLYLVFIIGIAILGAFYQILKINRKKPRNHINSNFITENVESHLDRIKQTVDNIIAKISPQDNKPDSPDYLRMDQLPEVKNSSKIKDQNLKERNSYEYKL